MQMPDGIPFAQIFEQARAYRLEETTVGRLTFYQDVGTGLLHCRVHGKPTITFFRPIDELESATHMRCLLESALKSLP